MKIGAVREKRIRQLDWLICRWYDRAVFVAGCRRSLFQGLMVSVPRVFLRKFFCQACFHESCLFLSCAVIDPRFVVGR